MEKSISSSPSAKIYREVVVQPLAAGREALTLALLIAFIIVLMGLRCVQLTPDQEKQEMPPYQISDLVLKSQAPVLYRSLLGCAADIIDLRELDGQWPDVALLMDEELPPFAGNFLPAGLRGFVWQYQPHNGWADYYGINEDTGQAVGGRDPLKNSFILRIIDFGNSEHPHPHLGTHPGAGKYGIQVWINSQTVEYPNGSLIERGWKWIVGTEDAGSEVTTR